MKKFVTRIYNLITGKSYLSFIKTQYRLSDEEMKKFIYAVSEVKYDGVFRSTENRLLLDIGVSIFDCQSKSFQIFNNLVRDKKVDWFDFLFYLRRLGCNNFSIISIDREINFKKR